MIAVDTNVLLRRLLNDDEHQAKKANHLFNSNKIILITDVVLAETVWTLKGKRYNARKEEIEAVIMSLLEEPNVVFESQQTVWSALNDYLLAKPVKTSGGNKMADFADALIVNKSKITANVRQENYQSTYTFDKAVLQIPGTLEP